MKVLIFWDVYGRIGRNALKKEIPLLKEKYSADFVITNIENCTSGRWPIEKHILELEELWIDVMTSWDHIFDNIVKVQDYIQKPDSKLIRWANYYETQAYKIPGKWYKIVEKNWKRLLVIHLIGEIFMHHKVYNPFLKAREILEELKDEKIDGIIIDFHKEATSEWYGLANYLDGEVSFIFGTHTHVQTNDDIILEKWTWLLSDVWMNWSLYSVIWADYKSVKKRFLTWINKWKIEQSLDTNYVVSGVFVEIWDDWKCESIEKIRIKWEL